MDKKTKRIIIIVCCVIAAVAAVAAVIYFREDIKKAVMGLVDKVTNKDKYSPEELEDFADI